MDTNSSGEGNRIASGAASKIEVGLIFWDEADLEISLDLPGIREDAKDMVDGVADGCQSRQSLYVGHMR